MNRPFCLPFRLRSQSNAGYGAEPGPSRADLLGTAFRPIEASKAAIRNGRFTSTPAIRSRLANAASRLKNWITEPAPAPTMAAFASMVSLIRWAFHPDHAVLPWPVPEARPDRRLSALCGGRGLDIGRRVTRLGGSATAERHAPETPERQSSRASSSQGRRRTARRQAERRAAGRPTLSADGPAVVRLPVQACREP